MTSDQNGVCGERQRNPHVLVHVSHEGQCTRARLANTKTSHKFLDQRSNPLGRLGRKDCNAYILRTMIATKTLLRTRVTHFRQPIQIAVRGMADVEVEHGRGKWQTYGDISNYKQGNYQIKTFNKISPVGLSKFPEDRYDIRTGNAEAANAHAILLRSHKLQEDEVPNTVRAIARCGAGTNNIPVARMTELGIPVFNTPGANANAVKELVLCGLLLGSRGVIDGINHMKELGKQGLARERVEKDKSMFGGQEISGKTLAVIGLGKKRIPIYIYLPNLNWRFAKFSHVESVRTHWIDDSS